MILERCDTLKEAREALEKYAGIARTMTDFNSLTERQRHFQRVLREARQVASGLHLMRMAGQQPQRRMTGMEK